VPPSLNFLGFGAANPPEGAPEKPALGCILPCGRFDFGFIDGGLGPGGRIVIGPVRFGICPDGIFNFSLGGPAGAVGLAPIIGLLAPSSLIRGGAWPAPLWGAPLFAFEGCGGAPEVLGWLEEGAAASPSFFKLSLILSPENIFTWPQPGRP
jgi:hypothetical protein